VSEEDGVSFKVEDQESSKLALRTIDKEQENEVVEMVKQESH
jgi:hypothetical protein